MADGAAIAARAKSYVHRVPYRWGGASPRGWDCSGMVNYVLCHDLGYAIPGYRGGTFTGQAHGPATGGWYGFPGMRNLGRGQIAAGDIVLWSTHMGIAVGALSYVSAFDTQLGTVIEPIHGGGPTGEVASFWRLTETPHGGAGGGGGGGGGGGPGTGGPQWNSMQAAWRHLSDTLGHGGAVTFGQINSIRLRMERLQRK